jgi:hypothetical protein
MSRVGLYARVDTADDPTFTMGYQPVSKPVVFSRLLSGGGIDRNPASGL